MLSSEQKSKQATAGSNDLILAAHNAIMLREAKSSYDIDRVTELWANLTMIQQMRGNDHWLRNSQNSTLTWNEYISRLIESKGAKVITFEKEGVVFGFAYMNLENINATNPNLRTNLKAIIKEIYLEPGYRKEIGANVLPVLMQKALKKLQINYFEIDVEDLDI